MTEAFAYDVFLSHRAHDKARVRQMAERLRATGLRVWFDEWVIRPGDDIYLTIERGLEASRTLVLCLSPAALQSGWVDLERSTALFRDPGNRDRRFVPVLLEDTPLPDTLRRYRYIDYRRADDAAFDELVSACTGVAPGPADSPDQRRPPRPRSVTTGEPPPDAQSPERPDRRTSASPRSPSPRGSSFQIGLFAALALGAFMAALVLLLLMLYKAEVLVGLGLIGNLYYLVLVPLGLAVAAFLFGVLRSYAVYTGRVAHGTLELGGPIVGFLLVILLGFTLVPTPKSFAVTVFVHGESGPQDVVLRNRGTVFLDLGGDRRREAVGEKGQAYFPGIPPSFRGQAVTVLLDAEGFELANPGATVKLDRESVYLAIRPKAGRMTGYVKRADGQAIVGATVSVAGSSTSTDKSGFFTLALPGPVAKEGVTLQVTAPGYAAWQSRVEPGGNEITVQLQKGN